MLFAILRALGRAVGRDLGTLSARQRFLLRLASLLLSPVVWLTLVLLLKTAPSLALVFLAAAVGVQALLVFWRRAFPPVPPVPPFPGLLRKNLRQMLSVLDPYLALALRNGGSIYKFATPSPDPAAFPILAILVALALSTYAQCLFSLDSASGITRYRLLPLRGWQAPRSDSRHWRSDIGPVWIRDFLCTAGVSPEGA